MSLILTHEKIYHHIFTYNVYESSEEYFDSHAEDKYDYDNDSY